MLPNLNTQEIILELLLSIYDAQQKQGVLIEELLRFKKSALKEAFSKENCFKIRVADISENLDNRRVPIKRSVRTSGPYPYFGASGIVDYVNEYIFDEPILLISEDGENLNSRKLPIAYEVDEKCWVNNHAHVLKITKASRYLVAEYFNSHDVSDYITGGTRPKITKGMLSDMPVYLPKSSFSINVENRLLSIDSAIEVAKTQYRLTQNLMASIQNKVF